MVSLLHPNELVIASTVAPPPFSRLLSSSSAFAAPSSHSSGGSKLDFLFVGYGFVRAELLEPFPHQSWFTDEDPYAEGDVEEGGSEVRGDGRGMQRRRMHDTVGPQSATMVKETPYGLFGAAACQAAAVGRYMAAMEAFGLAPPRSQPSRSTAASVNRQATTSTCNGDTNTGSYGSKEKHREREGEDEGVSDEYRRIFPTISDVLHPSSRTLTDVLTFPKAFQIVGSGANGHVKLGVLSSPRSPDQAPTQFCTPRSSAFSDAAATPEGQYFGCGQMEETGERNEEEHRLVAVKMLPLPPLLFSHLNHHLSALSSVQSSPLLHGAHHQSENDNNSISRGRSMSCQSNGPHGLSRQSHTFGLTNRSSQQSSFRQFDNLHSNHTAPNSSNTISFPPGVFHALQRIESEVTIALRARHPALMTTHLAVREVELLSPVLSTPSLLHPSGTSIFRTPSLQPPGSCHTNHPFQPQSHQLGTTAMPSSHHGSNFHPNVGIPHPFGLGSSGGSIFQAKSIALCMEYIGGCNLEQVVQYHGPLFEWELAAIVDAILSGLQYLHEHPDLRVAHRDVKPLNVMISSQMRPMPLLQVNDSSREVKSTGTGVTLLASESNCPSPADYCPVKLGDFGLVKKIISNGKMKHGGSGGDGAALKATVSMMVPDDPQTAATLCGTPAYIPPEVLVPYLGSLTSSGGAREGFHDSIDDEDHGNSPSEFVSDFSPALTATVAAVVHPVLLDVYAVGVLMQHIIGGMTDPENALGRPWVVREREKYKKFAAERPGDSLLSTSAADTAPPLLSKQCGSTERPVKSSTYKGPSDACIERKPWIMSDVVSQRVGPLLLQLLNSMIATDPQQRPQSIACVRAHPFFTQYRCVWGTHFRNSQELPLPTLPLDFVCRLATTTTKAHDSRRASKATVEEIMFMMAPDANTTQHVSSTNTTLIGDTSHLQNVSCCSSSLTQHQLGHGTNSTKLPQCTKLHLMPQ